MTQLGQAMTDLSKGYVPVAVLFAVLGTAIGFGFWFGTRSSTTELTSTQLAGQITRLEVQVSALSQQLQAINLSLAKGPSLPENIAFKSDLFQFCLANRNLKCPSFN